MSTNRVPEGVTLEGIKEQLTKLDIVKEDIRLAEQAGADVTQSKEDARKHRESLIRLKQTYFPNQT